MDLSALRHVLDEIPEAALADVDVKFVPCHDFLIFSDSLGDAFSRLVGILFLVLVCRLCWLCVPEELHIHIKAPFICMLDATILCQSGKCRHMYIRYEY